jgi:hypothetical protein
MRKIPRAIVGVHGEDVDLEVPGFFRLTATFLSEGLFDEEAGGDPGTEDLYEVELIPFSDSLLERATFPLLLPASSRRLPEDVFEFDEAPAQLPVERFLMALAWDLARAHPENWAQVCEAARHWDSWMIEDILLQIPPEWTPEVLLPDDE